MVRSAVAALLAVAALALGGCCSIARLACDWPLPECPPGAAGRTTPDAAVDFLVGAFRGRRIADLYLSFDPDFKRENGDFSQSEFGVAYTKAETEFAADAQSLADAERHWQEQRGDDVVVELSNPATGAFFPIAFRNHPRVRIVFDDPFVPPIDAPASLGAVVRMADGRITIDLTKLDGVQRETFGGLTEKNIVSLEFADDWQVRAIDTGRARNIRFLDKIKEYAGK